MFCGSVVSWLTLVYYIIFLCYWRNRGNSTLLPKNLCRLGNLHFAALPSGFNIPPILYRHTPLCRLSKIYRIYIIAASLCHLSRPLENDLICNGPKNIFQHFICLKWQTKLPKKDICNDLIHVEIFKLILNERQAPKSLKFFFSFMS